MRYDKDINRWWSAGRDWTMIGPLVLLIVFGLLLLLSGCGTTHSGSACPPIYAPAEITDRVPPPFLIEIDAPTPEDLIDNVAANGEQSNELRRRLLAIQRWAKMIGAH